ncbi:MAG: enoyl-CoA hydratase-related protein [Candidatus Kerfeldbacteria bacterium]
MIGIIGAGSIGRGLAYSFATALKGDCCVVLADINARVLESAKKEILQLAEKGHARGKMSATVKSQILSCFEFSDSLKGGPQSRTDFDLVIEAATENLELKRRILAQTEELVPADCLIGFTTSSLPCSEIARDSMYKERCFVMHPFFPAWKNPVMELTASRNPEMTARADETLRRLGKVPVHVADSPLFAGNILFCGMMDCACGLVNANWGTPRQVNNVLNREIGGGGVFLVHILIPNANNLTAECLEYWAQTGLFGLHDPMTAMMRAQDATPWYNHREASEEDEQIDGVMYEKIASVCKAYLAGLALHLLEKGVVSAFDLNWISRTALAFNKGVVEMMSHAGAANLFDWFDAAVNDGFINYEPPALFESDRIPDDGQLPQVYKNVKVDVDSSGVATVTVFRPPVNPLNAATILELSMAFKQLDGDDSVKGVIFTGFNGILAGADVTELADLRGKPDEMAQFPRAGQLLTLQIEAMSKPVVAVVKGLCLGGGAEMAMACWKRVISTDAAIGQPEVNLGIIPGYGGTQRLPRLVGVDRALQMLRAGVAIGAVTALEYGWADAINLDPMKWAREMILTHGASTFKMKPMDARPVKPSLIPDAPLQVDIGHRSRAIDDILVGVVMRGIEKPLAEGLMEEAKASGRCGETKDHIIGLTNFVTNGPRVKAQFVHR